MNILNKYVLITGASSRIGYHLAKLFAADGYNLVFVSRNQQELDNKAREFKEFGIECFCIVQDLSDPRNAFALYQQVKALGIQIEILVNNADQCICGQPVDKNIVRELDIVDLDISSLVILTKLFLQEMMRRRSGKILNVAYVASKSPGPWQSVYLGNKAFVCSFTEAIREELKDSGITITALLPGITDTDFFTKTGMMDSKTIGDKSAMVDPSQLATEGYRRLMVGKAQATSAIRNNLQIATGNLVPNSTLAHLISEQQISSDLQG